MHTDSTPHAGIEAHVAPAGDGTWIIRIPALDVTGAATTYTGATRTARTLAAAHLEAASADVDVTVIVDAPDTITRMIRESADAEIRGRQHLGHAAAHRRAAAHTLYGSGYPLEAIGAIMGVTAPRVKKYLDT
ncbi:MAG: hypothetical protein LBE05_03545 [Microbacterium sp.]|jgi:DNA-directed RNA polymerase specialized sigma24 family protein|nr:hypothetical protein [Microbacterium sp.]